MGWFVIKKIDVKLGFWEYILVLGILTAPMTSLRIWKIGPSEILMLFWSIKIFIDIRFKFKIDMFMKFWLLFDLCLLIGFSYRITASIYTGPFLSETLTFIFFNIFVFAMSQYLPSISYRKLLKILYAIFYFSSCVYIVLYIYAKFVSGSLFGISLWWGGLRLLLFSENPHQLAFLLGPLVLIGLYLLNIKYIKGNKGKFLAYLTIVTLIIISIETKASTLIMVYFVISLVIIVMKNVTKHNSKKQVYKFLGSISFLLATCLLFYNYIYELLLKFIESDANGEGRILLWERGIERLSVSPIFGLGPGAHLLGDNIIPFLEVHNTYIDVALRGGVVGLFILLIMLFKSIYIVKSNIFAVSIVLFFCLYGIAGYSLRRITLWFFIMAIVYIYKNYKKENY